MHTRHLRLPPSPLLPPHRPAYLLSNAAGPAKYRGVNNSHLSPTAALFSPAQAALIVRSNLGLLSALGALGWAVHAWGARAVAMYYGVPYLIVNCWLVCITYLQHTDTYVPHFRGGAFSWLRGALATVDRSYGSFLDDAHHHIADSHVAHHLFSTMPWYNAVKATPYIKRALGAYYLADDTPVYAALYRAWSKCKYVDDKGEVLFFKGPKEFNQSKQGGVSKAE